MRDLEEREDENNRENSTSYWGWELLEALEGKQSDIMNALAERIELSARLHDPFVSTGRLMRYTVEVGLDEGYVAREMKKVLLAASGRKLSQAVTNSKRV